MRCNDDSLHNLLDADDGDHESRDVAEHLESCERCQTRLGQLAAEADQWEEARRWLSRGDADDGWETGLDRSYHRDHQRGRALAWNESMARQLLSPPSHPEMLGRIGRYDVDRLIGAGGMGVVFKAFDTELNRPVAVKILAPYLAGSGAARKRFAREARAAAAVVDEHVVAIHNVESNGEASFLVMQYVAGESLQTRLDRCGPLEPCEVLRIGMQTARGLAAAHAQGLVHRDVKPSNIMLEQGVERALLTDFGLARAGDDASLTHTGYHPGTPQYMSPEQARGESVDQQSDLFSLGSVMYAMCTGRPPFRAETSYGVLRRITDTQARSIREINPDIPLWLCRLIEKLHAKSPGDRFASAEETAGLLARCLAHVQQPDAQPLPDAISVLSRHRHESTSSRIIRLLQVGDRFLERIRWLCGVIPNKRVAIPTTLIFIAVVFVALVVFIEPETRDSDPLDGSHIQSRGPLTARNIPNVSHDPEHATSWDAADLPLRQLDTEVHEFVTRTDRFWDDIPISIRAMTDTSKTSTNQPISEGLNR